MDFEIVSQENVLWVTLYENCSNHFAPLNKMAPKAKHNKKTFKQLLLLNWWMDFEKNSQEYFSNDPLPISLKPVSSLEQDGCQS